MARRILPHIFDAAIVAIILIAGLFCYGDFYRSNEKRFSFYQNYFYSAVNVYCVGQPDVRAYNAPATQEVDGRIDLASISCDALEKSPKLEKSYFNGWHDTHPILSTLIGLNWRMVDFTWEALWPIVGSLAALTVLSFYLTLRFFGLPWYAAVLIFPATVPFAQLERTVLFLRDFSKVPFILISFALLGILFRPGIALRLRWGALAASTGMIGIGIGFRQDSVVLLPAILAAAAFTSSLSSKSGILRFSGDLAVIFLSFYLVGWGVDHIRTDQVVQLQGYPHFIVQGFADDFWKGASTEIPGISFLPLYSDMLAWAAVDANSIGKVEYFASLDPKYATSGLDLVAKYAGLSAADMVTRVFSGLWSVAHGYWAIPAPGIWLLLLLALVAIGKWRLGFFLMFAILSLAAAGSIQFSSRHILHLIMLDRVILAIVLAALLSAAWQSATSRLNVTFGLALWSGGLGAAAVIVIIVAAHLFQHASLSWLKGNLEALPWFPSQEAYRARYPNLPEAILRFTIDENKCAGEILHATIDVEGQKLSRPLDRLDGGTRSVYFAVFNPAIVEASVDVTPQQCVTERAWGPLGDGTTPPLQFFDPEAALKKQSIGRYLRRLVSSFL